MPHDQPSTTGALPLEAIASAAETLRRGGLVAFPTETVYGLGADAKNPDAVARVFALKGRPANNPLIVHVTGPDMAQPLTHWSARASRLAAAFWPGPLTLVLPGRGALPESVTAGGPTVAVRAPDHPFALALLFAFGGPLVGPSANPSGRTSPTLAQHVRDGFPHALPDGLTILDGGACNAGIESTVLDLSGPRACVLRPGVLGAAALSAALGEPVAPAGDGSNEAYGDTGTPLKSPGMLDSHYAPMTPAVLVESGALSGFVAARERGERVAAVAFSLDALGLSASHAVIPMPRTASAYAARLYAALREADALSPAPTLIVVESPRTLIAAATTEDAAVWHAVLDRLCRATRPGTP